MWMVADMLHISSRGGSLFSHRSAWHVFLRLVHGRKIIRKRAIYELTVAINKKQGRRHPRACKEDTTEYNTGVSLSYPSFFTFAKTIFLFGTAWSKVWDSSHLLYLRNSYLSVWMCTGVKVLLPDEDPSVFVRDTSALSERASSAFPRYLGAVV